MEWLESPGLFYCLNLSLTVTVVWSVCLCASRFQHRFLVRKTRCCCTSLSINKSGVSLKKWERTVSCITGFFLNVSINQHILNFLFLSAAAAAAAKWSARGGVVIAEAFLCTFFVAFHEVLVPLTIQFCFDSNDIMEFILYVMIIDGVSLNIYQCIIFL